MVHSGGRPRSVASIVVLALAGGLATFACSRTGLDLADLSPTPADLPDGGEHLPDSGLDAAAPPVATSPAPPPSCTPHEETCNGKDDDCDGKVDEDQPPIPCPGGSERLCVAGRYSACPQRCEACIPGSERVCFLSYCTYWAAETCAADGRSFGVCRERHVPPECEGVASKHKDSPALEQCCIDNGYCCHDEYDLDHDGNRHEMLGTCDEVSCSQ